MTCQECQPLAIDLARGLPPFDVGGAVQRSDVLSHIARCKRCAKWLEEQEALSEAFRAAAEADASLSAPPSVEANVMAAWRARQAQRQLSVVRRDSQEELHADTSPELLVRAWRPAWPVWRASAFAAAATIVLLALTLASLRWLNPPATGVVTSNSGANSAATSHAVSGGNAGTGNGAGASTPSPTAVQSSGAASESGPGQVTGHSEGTNAAVVEVLPDKRTKGRPTPPRAIPRGAATAGELNASHDTSAAPGALPERVGFSDAAGTGGRGARTTSVTRGVNAARRGSTTRAMSVARGGEFSERAFVLLPYVEPLRPTEMRHIMRVRMPHSQFVAGEMQASGVHGATVLADVLVGEDGTARAVRIVQ